MRHLRRSLAGIVMLLAFFVIVAATPFTPPTQPFLLGLSLVLAFCSGRLSANLTPLETTP